MRIFVKPAEGKAVRRPLAPFDRLPVDGKWELDGPHWRRLEAAGDVVIDSAGPAEGPSADPLPAAKKK
jgi:hypothetical protein